MEWKLNSQEWDALFDLKAEAVKVYVMGIRPYMDYSTGIVGIKRKISYQSLSEILHIPAETGQPEQRYTKRQIQWILGRLEKSGLITRIDNSFVKLKLNLASRDESVSERNVRSVYGGASVGVNDFNDENNINNQDSYNDDCEEVCTEECTPKLSRCVTPPENRYINNNITTCMSSSTCVDLKADAYVNEAVINIFDYWKLKLSHPRAVLDKKRKLCITKAIGLGYSENDLRDAIDGCSTSPFHMGKNAQKTKYDDLTLILRDASKIETFIEFKTNPPREQNGVTNNGKTGKHDWYYEKQLDSIREAKRSAGFG